MVELMLNDTGYETVHPFVVWLQVGVEVLDAHLFGAFHLLVYAWHREASFLKVALLFAFFDDVSVDESLEVALELRLVFTDAVEVDDDDADRQSHLRCCKPHAFSLSEGFKHVVDEFLQVGIICWNVFSHLAKHWLTEYVHW